VTASRAPRALAAFLRYGIAAILLVSAVAKFLDVAGFARILAQYRSFPEAALLPLAVAIPAVELLLALWLFSGRRLAAAALVSSALHAAYAAWSAASVLRGLRLPNCGCFGVFLPRRLSWSTVVEDLVLVAASLGLYGLVRRRT
jgi:methylamine utilization protein MauE